MPVTTSTSASLSSRTLRAQRRASSRQDARTAAEQQPEAQSAGAAAAAAVEAPPLPAAAAAAARRSTSQGSQGSTTSAASTTDDQTTVSIVINNNSGPQTRRRTRAREAAAAAAVAIVSSEKPPPATSKCEQQQQQQQDDAEEEEEIPSPIPKRARLSATSTIATTTRRKSTTTATATMSSSGSRYNLRSTTKTTAAAAAAAAVSPGDIARQIHFDSSSSTSSASAVPKQDTTTRQTLPPGVLDIYNPPCSHLAAAEKKNDDYTYHCNCPADINFYQGTCLATHHLLAYGAEFTQAMLETERRQLIDVFGPRVLLDDVCNGDIDKNDAPTKQTKYYNDVQYAYWGHDEPDDLLMTNLRYRVRCIDEPEWNDPRTFLFDMHTLPRQPFITNKMRTVLVNWMVELGLEYTVSSQAYHLAVSLLDGVLARGPTRVEYAMYNGSSSVMDSDSEDDDDNEDSRRNRRWELVHRCDFQALGCACMLIAAKMEDRTPPTVEDLVYISDSSFTASKLRRLEQRVCRQLDFRLHRVTPMHYINQFLRASHACPCASCQYDHPVMRQMVLYLLELSRVSFDLSYRKPSLIAAAAVYLARVTLGLKECRRDAKIGQGYWTKTLEYTTGYSLKDLANTVLLLHKYQCASERARNNASFTKYKRPSLLKVSLKTVPRIDVLGEEFGMNLVHDEMTFPNSEPDMV